jgi:hypothetical protein
MKSNLCKIWEIPGLLPLIYSFLLQKDIENEEESVNISEYLRFREICKTTKKQANQLLPFISATIKFSHILERWTQLQPCLQHLKISIDLFQSKNNPFLHLRSLCILHQHSYVLHPRNFQVWNNSLLYHLKIDTIITQESVPIISNAFPNLSFLYLLVESEHSFKISDFPKLQTLVLCVIYFIKQLEISNIPCLKTLELKQGHFDLVRLSKSPELISIVSCGDIKSLIFQDDVKTTPITCFRDYFPFLTHMHLPYCKLDSVSIMNLQTHVNWETMIHLSIRECCGWENIFPRLKLLESLNVLKTINEVNLPWANLKKLKKLGCKSPSCGLMTSISRLHSLECLTLFSDLFFILDCTQLLQFQTLMQLSVLRFHGQCVNVEAILQLPKHVEIQCDENWLTYEQLLIVEKRKQLIKE